MQGCFSGSKRVFKLAQSSAPKNDFYGKFGNPSDQVVDMEQYKEKAAASAEKSIELYRDKVLSDKSEPSKGGGKFAGKIITCLVSENPRREGTRGWKNYNIFIENVVHLIGTEEDNTTSYNPQPTTNLKKSEYLLKISNI